MILLAAVLNKSEVKFLSGCISKSFHKISQKRSLNTKPAEGQGKRVAKKYYRRGEEYYKAHLVLAKQTIFYLMSDGFLITSASNHPSKNTTYCNDY